MRLRALSLALALSVAGCGGADDGASGDAAAAGPGDVGVEAPVDDVTPQSDDSDSGATEDTGPQTGDDASPPEDVSAPDSVECDWTVPPPPTGPVNPGPATDDDGPTGTVTGRLVHPDGTPIEAMRMLACTASICYWDETDADGRFEVSDLTLEPLKMQTGDPSGMHLDLLFYHLLETEEVSELPADVIVPLRDEQEPAPWSDEGGTVTLANGALEIHAEPGALTYPFGTLQDAVRAMRVEGSALPPYDWAPWADVLEDTFAFVINPIDVKVEPGATLRVHGVTDDPCGIYRIWSVAGKHGTVTYAGTATVMETEDGLTLVSDEGAAIHDLTTLVFSPL